MLTDDNINIFVVGVIWTSGHNGILTNYPSGLNDLHLRTLEEI